MSGKRFGRLVGMDYSHTTGGHAYWVFACDCGEESVVSGSAVRAGNTTSCGCLHRQLCADRLTVHGRRARKRQDSTYRAWQEINTYCSNPASPRFGEFGALGIRVDQSWQKNFEAFLRAMGERPMGTKLSRIDNAGNFTPDNCRWTFVASRSDRARRPYERMIASIQTS